MSPPPFPEDLFDKWKGTIGRGRRQETGSEYGQNTLYTCVKKIARDWGLSAKARGLSKLQVDPRPMPAFTWP